MLKPWIRGAVVAGLLAGLGSGSAAAAPEPLRAADLDRVVAGAVGDIDQLRPLIEAVLVPRLLALQQRLRDAGSTVSIDIGALLEFLDYQPVQTARTVGAAGAARTAVAAPDAAVSRSGIAPVVRILPTGSVELIIASSETTRRATASNEASAADLRGATVVLDGISVAVRSD